MGSLSHRAPVLRTLSPLDYQGLVATGVVLATVLGLLMQEPLADAECRRSALAAQERFGFVAGEVIRHEFPMFMIAGITPGGIFERAGLRPGDVPMAHHDGMAEFCYALERSASGREAEFTVINSAEWKDGWQRARNIHLPAQTPH